MNQTRDHKDEHEIDRFEARFFGAMSKGEARAFDAELERDPSLRERYRAFRLAVAGIRAGTPGRAAPPSTDELRERMRRIDSEMDSPAMSIGRWMIPAMAAVLLVALGIWWLLLPPEHVRLAEEYELPEPGLPVLMDHDGNAMDEIMNRYKTGRFMEADDLVTEQLRSRPDNDTLLYFAAVIAENNTGCEKALERYDRVAPGSAYADRARYRKAICLLKEGDRTGARKLLREMRGVKDPQLKVRVERLLNDL